MKEYYIYNNMINMRARGNRLDQKSTPKKQTYIRYVFGMVADGQQSFGNQSIKLY